LGKEVKKQNNFKMKNIPLPALFQIFKQKYGIRFLLDDLSAGAAVSVLAIPFAIAFAIASGVRPEQGLSSAIICSFLVALFGGCRFQMSGPTGTFALLILTTIQYYGYEGLVLATIFGGVILCLMGLFHFGYMIKFIPYPVIIGFTSGVAIVLFISQLPHFLGITLPIMPKTFLTKCSALYLHLPEVNFFALGIGILSIAIILLAPRYIKKIPGAIIAIIVTSILVNGFNLPVDTIKDAFGNINGALPSFHTPVFEWNLFLEVIPTSIAFALLISIESLLSAIVADGMTGTRHDSNIELIGQGLANIGSVLFLGIPTTGSLVRTAHNIKNGAHSPLAAITSSLIMVVCLLALGKWLVMVPISTLASIILVIAYNLSDWRVFAKLFLSPKRDIAVLLTTFLLAVFTDVTTALEIGIILATFLFVDKASKTMKSQLLNAVNKDLVKNDESFVFYKDKNIPDEIDIFEISGPLFFAATEKFKQTLMGINHVPKVLILRMLHVPSIDATGIRALEDILLNARRKQIALFLSGVSWEVRRALERCGFLKKLGPENAFNHLDEAIAKACELCKPPEPVPEVIMTEKETQ
jgi:SulP family sulfate permease